MLYKIFMKKNMKNPVKTHLKNRREANTSQLIL